MRRTMPIFYSALLLTGVNLLLRFAGTSFQVYLSGAIGASGVGLLQLTMSVGTLAMVAGTAGVRTAAMYLTAEELGKHRRENVSRMLSGCFLYSILCSGTVSFLLYHFAPFLAQNWVGDIRTLEALRLFAAFLPITCLCGCMTGYFTAANRIGTLAAVEVAEQLVSMAFTLILLKYWASTDSVRACQAVILGSSLGCCLTLLCLVILRLREKGGIGPEIPVARRLLAIAAPLAVADVAKSGISTLENLMVPRRLGLYRGIGDPLAAFGTVCGMVFPVLMFPACILFGLSELLLPEFARCAAAGSHGRIRYLTRKGLHLATLYGCTFGGLLFLLAPELCEKLYHTPEAGIWLRYFSVLAPMLYCDAITDAITKGLGQQKTCVRNNILTSVLDVVFLYVLLPEYGLHGYFASFFLTHLLNFILSLRLLLRITKEHLDATVPLRCLIATFAAVWISGFLPTAGLRTAAFLALLGSSLVLLKVVSITDLNWFLGLIRKTSPTVR